MVSYSIGDNVLQHCIDHANDLINKPLVQNTINTGAMCIDWDTQKILYEVKKPV